eukprot:2389123-Heterocapsa_arctica.AAC.1
MEPKVVQPLPLNTFGLPEGSLPITSNPYAVDVMGNMPMRAQISKVDQLKNIIMRALVINHGPPVTRSYEEAGTWYVFWRWGTNSTWPVTNDYDTLWL